MASKHFGPIYPAISSVTRQIHNEATAVLYGEIIFFAHPSLLTGLPKLRVSYSYITSDGTISRTRRYHIRVRIDCDARFTKEQAKETFSGVEEMTVEACQAQFGGSQLDVLKPFEDLRGVKYTRVIGSVSSFPEYAKWLGNAIMLPVEG